MRCSACGSPAGFGSEQFGRLRCVVTRANLQPAVAAYVRRPGDSAWRALALDVLRIEDGVIAEIVTFPPDCFLPFGLPLIMDVGVSFPEALKRINVSTEGTK